MTLNINIYAELILAIVSGGCWTAVYIWCIVFGFKTKTQTMPLWPLALNITWELMYSFFALKNHIDMFHIVQGVINLIWAILDIFIVISYFKFEKKYFTKNLSQNSFYIWTVIVIILSFGFQIALYYLVNQDDLLSSIVSAFIQNAIMSIAYYAAYYTRKDKEGQSLFIGINKWIGTFAPTLMFGVFATYTGGFGNYGVNIFVLITGAMCFIFDVAYIYLLIKPRIKKLNK